MRPENYRGRRRRPRGRGVHRRPFPVRAAAVAAGVLAGWSAVTVTGFQLAQGMWT